MRIPAFTVLHLGQQLPSPDVGDGSATSSRTSALWLIVACAVIGVAALAAVVAAAVAYYNWRRRRMENTFEVCARPFVRVARSRARKR